MRASRSAALLGAAALGAAQVHAGISDLFAGHADLLRSHSQLAKRNTANQTASPYCNLSGRNITVSKQSYCTDLAAAYSVADWQVISDNPRLGQNGTVTPESSACAVSAGTVVCLQQPCNTYVVKTNDTCASIAANAPGYAALAPYQLANFNPQLGVQCSNIANSVGDRICISVNGAMPSGANTTMAAPTATPTTLAPVPSPTAPGSTAGCGRWYNVTEGDICDRVCLANGVTFQTFQQLNPEINAGCTNLWLGYYYCVAPYPPLAASNSSSTAAFNTTATTPGGASIVSATATSAPASTISTSTTPFVPSTYTNVGVPAPSNLANGSLSYACAYYANVTSAYQNCANVTNTWQMTQGNLTAWNPEINCSNASSVTALKGKAICVVGPLHGVPPAPVPSNAAPGTSPNCTSYYTAVSGDSCSSVATAHGLTLAQFESYNTGLNSQCSNFYAGSAYCVAVTASATATATGTTSTTTAVTSTASGVTTAPTNVASGTPTSPSQCNLYYTVQSGDSCGSIATKFSISIGSFQKLNPELSSTCNNLYGGEAYCVGSSSTPLCATYYTVQSGDSCSAIDTKYGISFSTFQALNPNVDSACDNIVVGQAYCVAQKSSGTSSASGSSAPTSAPKSSTATTTTKAATSTSSSCPQTYKVVSGDTCSAIASKYNITVSQLEAMNPAINSGCTNLQIGQVLCV